MKELIVQSPEFDNDGQIPAKYTCDGDNVNPPLDVADIPEGTKSLVIIAEDPHEPGGPWVLWVMWNILPEMPIEEDTATGLTGVNSYSTSEYRGPCPPQGSHKYFFRVYALDTLLDIEINSGKEEVQKAMEGHVLAKGELAFHYSRTIDAYRKETTM